MADVDHASLLLESGSCPGAPIDRATACLYPEIHAGGFCHEDQRAMFYLRVNAILRPEHRVLDFGAGRGRYAELDRGTLVDRLATLRGRCRELVGFDVDPVVFENPMLDRAFCAPVGAPLPSSDGEFDMIVSWAVLEHIESPEFYARELDRILRPGGWFCAWTPNKWGLPAIAARSVPNSLHPRLLRWLGSDRTERDQFPTFYRMNTLRQLRKLFPGFRHYSFFHNGPPGYHGGRLWLARIIGVYNHLMPKHSKQHLHVFLRKDEHSPR
jgi:SAM-dependent methyltransferase